MKCSRCGSTDRTLDAAFICCTCYRNLEERCKRLEEENARLQPDCPCPDCAWKAITIRDQGKAIEDLRSMLKDLAYAAELFESKAPVTPGDHGTAVKVLCGRAQELLKRLAPGTVIEPEHRGLPLPPPNDYRKCPNCGEMVLTRRENLRPTGCPLCGWSQPGEPSPLGEGFCAICKGPCRGH